MTHQRSLLGLLVPLVLSAWTSAAEVRDRQLASKAFRAAVAKALPSIVTIETYGGVRAPAAPRTPPRGPRRRRRRMAPVAKPGEGPTTGLIVSADGGILTSTFNFLRKPPIITVVLADGARHVARLLGRDDTRKLCLLKIDGVRGLPVAAHAPRAQLRVGQWAISVGYGYGGEQPAISTGILSALARISGKAVQTDANISPANYGGPLLDVDGRVIGVCVPLSPREQGTAGGAAWYDSGIGFAIPTAGLEPIVEQLRQGKVLRPGRLGIQPGRAAPKGGGVTVQSVQKGSGAEKAGIKPKDVIVALDGEPIPNLLKLRILLGQRLAGDEVTVKIRRGDKTLELRVVLSAGDPPAPQAPRRSG